MMRPLFATILPLLLFGFASPTSAQLDPASASAWADAQLGKPVAEGRASAATVAIVKGGTVLLTRSYGYGDRALKTPVASPRSRFIIASTTKTFTATAIALLVQDGRIASLDDPANKYLKRMKLPDGFGRAVTIRQLLTHSAGYEERGFGVGAPGERSAPASADYVRAHLPAIVRQPGSRIVYANIDPAILGMVVEDITGMTMRDFLAKRLLIPLGMKNTELAYSAGTTARLVRPYTGNRAAPWDINAPFFAPTGSIHTTADDMATYMNAQLGHAAGVLPTETVARLHGPLARNGAALDPLAMAFFVSQWNGARIVGHAGAFSGFSTDMYLIPGSDIGVFYTWAGSPAPGKGEPLDYGKLQASFLTLALGKFLAPAPLAVQPDPSAFYGRYWDERRPQTTFETIVGASAVHTVAPAPGNRLTINGKGPYYAFAPNTYTMVNDDGRPGGVISFDGGRLLQRVGYATRVTGLDDPGTQTTLTLGALVVLLTGMLGAIWMRGRARLIAPLIALAALTVPLVLFVLPPGLEPSIIGGDATPFIVLKLTLVAIVALAAWLGWTLATSKPKLVARIHGGLIGIAAVVLIVPFAFFHLI